jgi:hypothetical protein
MRLAAHGLALEVPRGWEARIFRHAGGAPTLHAANFALPSEDGDFGTRAVEQLTSDGVFVVVTEYDADLAGQGLFASEGLPVPLPEDGASPVTLLRRLPGQAGIQRFFSLAGRAFCLYVVVGSRPSRRALVSEANRLLRSLVVARSA